MTQLANAQQSKTKEVGMDKANLEHIFPQNAGSEWPNRSALEPFTWHVGNLTILGKRINNKAQNKSFSDKSKDHYTNSDRKMTRELLKEAGWNEAAIRNRAQKLWRRLHCRFGNRQTTCRVWGFSASSTLTS